MQTYAEKFRGSAKPVKPPYRQSTCTQRTIKHSGECRQEARRTTVLSSMLGNISFSSKFDHVMLACIHIYEC